MTDNRATAAQQQALVSMARSLAPGVFNEVITTTNVPITFLKDKDGVQVSAGSAKLEVVTEFEHPMTCGATRWFNTLAQTEGTKPGLTRSQEWSGAGLGAQWKHVDRKSSFVGTFSYKQ